MAPGREPPGADDDGCTGRQADIASALLERTWPWPASVDDCGEGEYRVTLPSLAARELGIGTASSIPEWHLTTRLGVEARVSDCVSHVSGAGDRRTAFTVRLHRRTD